MEREAQEAKKNSNWTIFALGHRKRKALECWEGFIYTRHLSQSDLTKIIAMIGWSTRSLFNTSNARSRRQAFEMWRTNQRGISWHEMTGLVGNKQFGTVIASVPSPLSLGYLGYEYVVRLEAFDYRKYSEVSLVLMHLNKHLCTRVGSRG